MEENRLITELTHLLYRDLVLPFISEEGVLNDAKIEQSFHTELKTVNKEGIDGVILRCKQVIKKHNSGLSMKFDKLQASILDMVTKKVKAHPKGSEMLCPCDMNKLNTFINELKDDIYANGIYFLKEIEGDIVNIGKVTVVKEQVSRKLKQVQDSTGVWHGKNEKVYTYGFEAPKDKLAELLKFNVNIGNAVAKGINSLPDILSAMSYELDGMYYDISNGIEPAFILKYKASFEEAIIELSRLQVKALQYETDNEYNWLFPEDRKQSLLKQVGLICLSEYLELRKTGEIKNLIKEGKWNDFMRICKELAKKEFYETRNLDFQLFIYDADSSVYIWQGIGRAKAPTLGRFISVLRDKGFFIPQSKNKNLVNAFVHFFNAHQIKDKGFISKNVSKGKSKYDFEILPLVEEILSLP